VPPRLFTLEQASALLPAVRQLMAAIQGKKREVDKLSEDLESQAAKAGTNGNSSASRSVAIRAATERAALELDQLVHDLEATGCELKGIDEGLVDFQSLREGRVVYLCWKMGEEEIRFWHELDSGFPGRKPL
jgi:hypothetical protein